MKKLFLLVLSCFMIISLSACGEEKEIVSGFSPVTSAELTEDQAIAIFENAQDCIYTWYGLNEECYDRESGIERYNDFSK